MDWSKLPDVVAVALLTVAFASVARYGRNSVSGVWLIGWLMIVLHFFAFMFLSAPGHWSDLANFVGTAALVCAGVLFMWASVPYRKRPSSHWMLAVLLGANALYLGLNIFDPAASWALVLAAALFGALPLAVVLLALPRFIHPLRWTIAGLYAALSIFLLIFQNRPGDGTSLALNAVLFTVYFGCFIHCCVCLPARHGRRLHHHSGVLCLGRRFRCRAAYLRLFPQPPSRERGLESAQVCRCRGHDFAAS